MKQYMLIAGLKETSFKTPVYGYELYTEAQRTIILDMYEEWLTRQKLDEDGNMKGIRKGYLDKREITGRPFMFFLNYELQMAINFDEWSYVEFIRVDLHKPTEKEIQHYVGEKETWTKDDNIILG